MKKVLFLILCIISVPVNAQRLNSDGLKMVSKVTVNHLMSDKIIEFSYDNENKLREVVYTYIEKRRKPYNVYKEVITKNNNEITQKSYFNGKPYHLYEYKYRLNSDGKIVYMGKFTYTQAQIIARREREFYYEDSKLIKINFISSGKVRTPFFCYEPGYDCTEFTYDNKGYYYTCCNYSLSNEQIKKYAPYYTEDEYKESKNTLIRRNGSTYWKSEFSDNAINDTNIGLNRLYDLSKFTSEERGVGSIRIPLFFTEWIGLRENNLVIRDYLNKVNWYDVEYKYDNRGNIVNIDYIYHYMERTDKDCNYNVKIEYLEF